MKANVYVESSVLSYLTALPSQDVIRAAHQRITWEWWSKREKYRLHLSEFVLAEIARGDPEAAKKRLFVAKELNVLGSTEEAKNLAEKFIKFSAMPMKAALDALHVALATVHGIEFLLTWNCTHIANAVMRPRIEAVCREAGYLPTVICTPEELTEEGES